MIACVIGEECGGAVPDGSPLALCERHLAVAAEWSSTVHGLTDVLPSPCRLCGGRLGLRLASGWLRVFNLGGRPAQLKGGQVCRAGGRG